LTQKAVEKLITEIAPAFKNRQGGYTRVVKLGNRQGDNAKMAAVMLTEAPKRAADTAPKADSASKKTSVAKAKKPIAKKPAAKKKVASA
ncbi:MAG TPA: L17 family ribosomal protein, partial [Candidatus Saccharimonadia bacterium]